MGALEGNKGRGRGGDRKLSVVEIEVEAKQGGFIS